MATRIAIMDRGVIQQIGSPDEVYERPANVFVANFIGAPPMNMLDAKVQANGNALTALHEPTGTRIDLSGYGFESRPTDGQAITVGLRPEHFSLGNAMGSAAVLTLPLAYTEKTGSDATAFVTAKEQLLAARIDPSEVGRLSIGQPVSFSFPRERLNVFDAQSGRRM